METSLADQYIAFSHSNDAECLAVCLLHSIRA